MTRITRRAIALIRGGGIAAGLLVCSPPVSAQVRVPSQLPPVVLIHGIWSNAGTWDDAIMNLTGNLQPFQTYRWDTETNSTINSQKNDLVGDLQRAGIFDQSPVIAAHSMGGIVARHLLHEMQADALITVGTPHHGHPIINNGVHATLARALDFAALSVPIFNLMRCDHGADVGEGEDRGPCMYTWHYLDALAISQVVLLAADEFIKGTANSISDMRPDGTFMNTLNATIADERVGERFNFEAQLWPEEEYLGPFRLIFPVSEAYYWSGRVFQYGWDMIIEGGWLLAEVFWADDWYWERLYGGTALVLAGDMILDTGPWWSMILGGFPHDGFMPVSTQFFAGAPSMTLMGASHIEETGDFRVSAKIAEIGHAHAR